jgi:hypothetical protein
MKVYINIIVHKKVVLKSSELIPKYKKYVKLFQLCVTQSSRSFNTFSSYWLTSFSSRDRYNSNIQDYFILQAHLDLLISKSNKKTLEVYCKDYLTFKMVRQYLFQHNIHAVISFKNWINLYFKHFLSYFRKVKGLLILARELFFLFIYSILRYLNKKENKIYEYVFICPLDLPLIYDCKHNYKDRYFGYLPFKFFRAGKKIAIFGTLPNGIKLFRRKSNLPKEYLISPILSTLSMPDWIQLFFISLREIFFPPRVDLRRKSFLRPFHHIVNYELFNSYSERIIGRALYLSVRNIIRRSPKVNLIHTFENNAWEKAILQSFRKYSEGGAIIGYHHCAVLQSHQKNYTDNIEMKRRPFPDRVYTTGLESKKAMCKIGKYPKKRIRVGEDLRGPKLQSIPIISQKPKKIKNILFLMEGLISMENILKIIIELKEKRPELEFSVRPHPALSWDSFFLASLDSVLAGKIVKLDPSESINLHLKTADAVIYKGSTSVLYAAYSGIPLLRYRDDWWLSDDPLFFGEVIKEEFESKEELFTSILKLDSIPDDEFFERVNKQRLLISNYLKQSERANI